MSCGIKCASTVRKCVTCGRGTSSKHRLFQLLTKMGVDEYDDFREMIFRRGFSIPMCGKCLWKFRFAVLGVQVFTLALCAGLMTLCGLYWKWDVAPSKGKVVLAIIMVLFAVLVPVLFYLLARIVLSCCFLYRIDVSKWREFSGLMAEGYDHGCTVWPRFVCDAKDKIDHQKERHFRGGESGRRWRTEITDYKWIGDFDGDGFRLDGGCADSGVRAKVPSKGVGDAALRKKALDLIQSAPAGVSVVALAGTGGYRIAYRRRRISQIIWGFLWITFAGTMVGAFIHAGSGAGGLGILFSCGLFVGGCICLVRELFGETKLVLTPKGGSYTADESFLGCHDEEFPLSPETLVNYRIRRGFWDVQYRDIVVENKGKDKVCFGASMPDDVQDYFCACMSCWKAGVPLAVSGGAESDALVKHPFLFYPALAVSVLLFAYTVSVSESVSVRQGKVTVVKSDFWGCRKDVVEIPFGDIRGLEVQKWSIRHGLGRRFHIIGHDGKVIAKFDVGDDKVSEYKEGIENAAKSKFGQVFERQRKRDEGIVSVILAIMFGLISLSGLNERRCHG